LHNEVHGDLLISVKSIFSEEYCRDVSIKTRSALDIKRRNGDYVGTCAVFGYQREKRLRNRLVIDEYAADIVQSIFSMKLQGMNAAKIALVLNEQGIPSPLKS
jgi:DNA invertase Pin-like site-specific DNA recombinase